MVKSKIMESEHTTLSTEKFENFSWQQQPETLIRKKMSEHEKKRRFTDEQIRALEFIFESEGKLEPRKKLQLAKELGLQPRQIAIWFQNRRARWKVKQIEQDYRELRVDYDTLLSRFESLKKENESLQDEFERLRDRTGRSDEAVRENEVVIKGNNLRGRGIVDGEKLIMWEAGKKASCSNGGLDDIGGLHLLDEKKSNCYLEDKNGPLTSTEKWYSVDPRGMLDQSCTNSHWLDIWT